MARRVCSAPGCPVVVDRGRCPECRRADDLARGTRQHRGYDQDHDKLRREWAPRVAAGNVTCWRPTCRRPIDPGEPWHLGHDDTDRRITRGPEHALCNLSAAGKSAHGK